MSPGKKATPGTTVSVAEVNDLIIRVRDLRTHLNTNARHLAMIETRLNVLEAVVETMKDSFTVVEEEEPVEVPEEPPVEELDDAEVAAEEEEK